MATTIGSLDLNAFSDLYSDSTQYFWFESNASATYGAGAHVTLVPDTSFISNPTGQNILMNTDGFSIRNGLLPMMTLDNDSLDFNVVDTTAGTYTTTATFTATGAQIGQSGAAHSVIDANGQRFYASNGTTQLANIGYGEGQSQTGTAIAPYYTFGTRVSNSTIGNYSMAEGFSTTAMGANSHAEGQSTTASGYSSHAEGLSTTAMGASSHAEGNHTTASVANSHAEGDYTTASGIASHAEGNYTTASERWSHAEGDYTTASGMASHAEGNYTTASGNWSHAEGNYTTSQGTYSHAQNLFTVATENSQTVIGKYNSATVTGSGTTSDPYVYTDVGDYAFIIGNGTDNTTADRSNALTVDWNGNVIGQAMAGIIQMYAGSTPPTGWLVCDGSEQLVSDYPELAAVLQNTWGTPSSSDYFKLPDFRGRAPIGYGDGTATSHTQHNLGTYGGNEDLIIPYHNHSVNSVSIGSSGGHSHTITSYYKQQNAASGTARNTPNTGASTATNLATIASNTGTHTHSVPSHNTNYAGTSGNEVGANMMPYATISFIICTGKTY